MTNTHPSNLVNMCHPAQHSSTALSLVTQPLTPMATSECDAYEVVMVERMVERGRKIRYDNILKMRKYERSI